RAWAMQGKVCDRQQVWVVAERAFSNLRVACGKRLATIERHSPQNMEVEVRGAGQAAAERDYLRIKQAGQVGDGQPQQPARGLEQGFRHLITGSRGFGQVLGSDRVPPQGQ